MKRLIRTALALFIGVVCIDASAPDVAYTVFTEENFGKVPKLSPELLPVVREQLIESSLVSADIELGGRVWRVTQARAANGQEILDAVSLLNIILTIEGDPVVHSLFSVDSEGYIRYPSAICSSAFDVELGAGEYRRPVRFHLTSKLTAAELANPLIQAMKRSKAFSEEDALVATNRGEYENYLKEGANLPFEWFLMPDYRSRYAGYKKDLLEIITCLLGASYGSDTEL